MSPGRRDLAWFVAGFLSAAAIALFAWLMRPSAPGAAIAAGATAGPSIDASGGATDVMPSAATPDGGAASNAGSMGEMLARLEARLAAQGGTDADWELLAQTYEFMGRRADATSARSHRMPGGSAAAAAAAAAGASR